MCRGKEKQYLFNKLCEMANTVSTMPKNYEQDGLGKNAVAHLHYFLGGMDWYITEKDMLTEQHQAFGWAMISGYDGELGYISIIEILENGAELNLHWTPKPLKDIK
jgi:hypothetical protein